MVQGVSFTKQVYFGESTGVPSVQAVTGAPVGVAPVGSLATSDNGNLYISDGAIWNVIKGITIIPAAGTISGTYQGDVVCLGNVTVSGAVEVQGSLTVLGDITNSGGYAFTIRGDMYANQVLFDKAVTATPQSNVFIGGDLYYSEFQFRQCGGAPASMQVNGNLISTASGSNFLAEGVNLSTPGLTLEVFGDFIANLVDLSGWPSDGSAQGGNGGTLTVHGDFTSYATVFLNGGTGTGGFDAGSGGSVYVWGDLINFDTFGLIGGDGSGASAGNGGYMEVYGNVAAYFIDMYGGNCNSNTPTHRSGSGGTLQVYDGNVTANRDISLNGGDRTGTLASAAGETPPDAGDFFCGGNFTARSLNIYGGSVLTSGFAPHAAGDGGSIQVRGTTTMSFRINAQGGDSFTGTGGSGDYSSGLTFYGACTISSSLNAYGGAGAGGSAGRGCYMQFYGPVSIDDILAYGGNATSGSGGSGGQIYSENAMTFAGSCDLGGGTCDSTSQFHFAGVGGAFQAAEVYGGTLTTSGGNRSGVTTVAAVRPAANGGSVDIKGTCALNNLYGNGGGVTAGYPNSPGGNGSPLTVYGALTVRGTLAVNGGTGRGRDGGYGGTLDIYGPALVATLSTSGGDADASDIGGDAQTNGSAGFCTFRNGLCSVSTTMLDGTGAGAASTTVFALRLTGSCSFGTINMVNRVGARIMANVGYPAMVKIDAMTTKQTLNDSFGSPTANISGNLADSIFASTAFSAWYRMTGVSI